MKVSVSIVTYNHENFIAKALSSVLMQRTNFDYEIVIGEDCSTDNTRNIVLDYCNRYPNKFKLLLNEKNMGMHVNGRQTLDACKGEYIAVLDGDDYWTSQDKLQKQVDVLDNNLDYAICFHGVTNVYLDGSREPENVFPPNRKNIYTVEELLGGNFIAHCSTMFRRGLADTPSCLSSLEMGDWPHHILCGVHGKIAYIDEVMATHVFHPAGIWYSFSQSWLKEAKAKIAVYDCLRSCLEPKYLKVIDDILPKLCLQVAEESENIGDLEGSKIYARRCLTKDLYISNRVLKILMKLYAPTLFKVSRFLKRALANI